MTYVGEVGELVLPRTSCLRHDPYACCVSTHVVHIQCNLFFSLCLTCSLHRVLYSPCLFSAVLWASLDFSLYLSAISYLSSSFPRKCSVWHLYACLFKYLIIKLVRFPMYVNVAHFISELSSGMYCRVK
jgi:hypothetical protein